MTIRICSWLLFILLLAGWELYCRVTGISELIRTRPIGGDTHAVERVDKRIFAAAHLGHKCGDDARSDNGVRNRVPVGVVLAEIEFLRRLLYPYIIASQVVPKLALGPLFIIWFGFGMTSTVVITALICFFPLLENTMTGLQHIDPQKRELFRMLRASRLQTLMRLKIPSGLPVILAGVRVAVVLALVGAIVGEFIGGRTGVGASIIAAQGMMDTTLMFALFAVITALGMVFYQAAVWIERWLLRRYLKG